MSTYGAPCGSAASLYTASAAPSESSCVWLGSRLPWKRQGLSAPTRDEEVARDGSLLLKPSPWYQRPCIPQDVGVALQPAAWLQPLRTSTSTSTIHVKPPPASLRARHRLQLASRRAAQSSMPPEPRSGPGPGLDPMGGLWANEVVIPPPPHRRPSVRIFSGRAAGCPFVPRAAHWGAKSSTEHVQDSHCC